MAIKHANVGSVIEAFEAADGRELIGAEEYNLCHISAKVAEWYDRLNSILIKRGYSEERIQEILATREHPTERSH